MMLTQVEGSPVLEGPPGTIKTTPRHLGGFLATAAAKNRHKEKLTKRSGVRRDVSRYLENFDTTSTGEQEGGELQLDRGSADPEMLVVPSGRETNDRKTDAQALEGEDLEKQEITSDVASSGTAAPEEMRADGAALLEDNIDHEDFDEHHPDRPKGKLGQQQVVVPEERQKETEITNHQSQPVEPLSRNKQAQNKGATTARTFLFAATAAEAAAHRKSRRGGGRPTGARRLRERATREGVDTRQYDGEQVEDDGEAEASSSSAASSGSDTEAVAGSDVHDVENMDVPKNKNAEGGAGPQASSCGGSITSTTSPSRSTALEAPQESCTARREDFVSTNRCSSGVARRSGRRMTTTSTSVAPAGQDEQSSTTSTTRLRYHYNAKSAAARASFRSSSLATGGEVISEAQGTSSGLPAQTADGEEEVQLQTAEIKQEEKPLLGPADDAIAEGTPVEAPLPAQSPFEAQGEKMMDQKTDRNTDDSSVPQEEVAPRPRASTSASPRGASCSSIAATSTKAGHAAGDHHAHDVEARGEVEIVEGTKEDRANTLKKDHFSTSYDKSSTASTEAAAEETATAPGAPAASTETQPRSPEDASPATATPSPSPAPQPSESLSSIAGVELPPAGGPPEQAVEAQIPPVDRNKHSPMSSRHEVGDSCDQEQASGLDFTFAPVVRVAASVGGERTSTCQTATAEMQINGACIKQDHSTTTTTSAATHAAGAAARPNSSFITPTTTKAPADYLISSGGASRASCGKGQQGPEDRANGDHVQHIDIATTPPGVEGVVVPLSDDVSVSACREDRRDDGVNFAPVAEVLPPPAAAQPKEPARILNQQVPFTRTVLETDWRSACGLNKSVSKDYKNYNQENKNVSCSRGSKTSKINAGEQLCTSSNGLVYSASPVGSPLDGIPEQDYKELKDCAIGSVREQDRNTSPTGSVDTRTTTSSFATQQQSSYATGSSSSSFRKEASGARTSFLAELFLPGSTSSRSSSHGADATERSPAAALGAIDAAAAGAAGAAPDGVKRILPATDSAREAAHGTRNHDQTGEVKVVGDAVAPSSTEAAGQAESKKHGAAVARGGGSGIITSDEYSIISASSAGVPVSSDLIRSFVRSKAAAAAASRYGEPGAGVEGGRRVEMRAGENELEKNENDSTSCGSTIQALRRDSKHATITDHLKESSSFAPATRTSSSSSTSIAGSCRARLSAAEQRAAERARQTLDELGLGNKNYDTAGLHLKSTSTSSAGQERGFPLEGDHVLHIGENSTGAPLSSSSSSSSSASSCKEPEPRREEVENQLRFSFGAQLILKGGGDYHRWARECEKARSWLVLEEHSENKQEEAQEKQKDGTTLKQRLFGITAEAASFAAASARLKTASKEATELIARMSRNTDAASTASDAKTEPAQLREENSVVHLPRMRALATELQDGIELVSTHRERLVQTFGIAHFGGGQDKSRYFDHQCEALQNLLDMVDLTIADVVSTTSEAGGLHLQESQHVVRGLGGAHQHIQQAGNNGCSASASSGSSSSSAVSTGRRSSAGLLSTSTSSRRPPPLVVFPESVKVVRAQARSVDACHSGLPVVDYHDKGGHRVKNDDERNNIFLAAEREDRRTEGPGAAATAQKMDKQSRQLHHKSEASQCRSLPRFGLEDSTDSRGREAEPDQVLDERRVHGIDRSTSKVVPGGNSARAAPAGKTTTPPACRDGGSGHKKPRQRSRSPQLGQEARSAGSEILTEQAEEPRRLRQEIWSALRARHWQQARKKLLDLFRIVDDETKNSSRSRKEAATKSYTEMLCFLAAKPQRCSSTSGAAAAAEGASAVSAQERPAIVEDRTTVVLTNSPFREKHCRPGEKQEYVELVRLLLQKAREGAAESSSNIPVTVQPAFHVAGACGNLFLLSQLTKNDQLLINNGVHTRLAEVKFSVEAKPTSNAKLLTATPLQLFARFLSQLFLTSGQLQEDPLPPPVVVSQGGKANSISTPGCISRLREDTSKNADFCPETILDGKTKTSAEQPGGSSSGKNGGVRPEQIATAAASQARIPLFPLGLASIPANGTKDAFAHLYPFVTTTSPAGAATGAALSASSTTGTTPVSASTPESSSEEHNNNLQKLAHDDDLVVFRVGKKKMRAHRCVLWSHVRKDSELADASSSTRNGTTSGPGGAGDEASGSAITSTKGSTITVEPNVVQDPAVWAALLAWCYEARKLHGLTKHWTALRWWQLLCATVTYKVTKLRTVVVDHVIRLLSEHHAPEVLGILTKSATSIWDSHTVHSQLLCGFATPALQIFAQISTLFSPCSMICHAAWLGRLMALAYGKWVCMKTRNHV
ncbi:unnamed protein product [Amoebophrya sp. A120]|nr:unnamed protein product [Amoebophrya sp. A120]|eukprot:GSA120T00000302001.1